MDHVSQDTQCELKVLSCKISPPSVANRPEPTHAISGAMRYHFGLPPCCSLTHFQFKVDQLV